jgi:hypothetical protein
MESFGIVDPQKRENFVLRLYVDEKFAHIKTNSEKVSYNFRILEDVYVTVPEERCLMD